MFFQQLMDAFDQARLNITHYEGKILAHYLQLNLAPPPC